MFNNERDIFFCTAPPFCTDVQLIANLTRSWLDRLSLDPLRLHLRAPQRRHFAQYTLSSPCDGSASRLLARIFLRRNVAKSLCLIPHKRDPAVPHHLDPCNDFLRLRARESDRDRTLFDTRDSLGGAKRGDFLSDLGGILTVFGFDLALVCLHELGCRPTKREHEMRLHALFH